MTWQLLLVWCVGSVPAALLTARVVPRKDSLAAAPPWLREGEGAHPASAGHGAPPRAVDPPPDVSRPNDGEERQ